MPAWPSQLIDNAAGHADIPGLAAVEPAATQGPVQRAVLNAFQSAAVFSGAVALGVVLVALGVWALVKSDGRG